MEDGLSMPIRLVTLVEEVEFLAAEQVHLASRGPEFIIYHRRNGGVAREDCCCVATEEELVSTVLRHGVKERPLPLSPSSLLVFDVLAASRLARIAKQIAIDARHRTSNRAPSFQARSVKVLIQRIRERMQIAFDEVGLKLESRDVLRSEYLDGRAVIYRLVATRRWIHFLKN
jgi:hypothetical protein